MVPWTDLLGIGLAVLAVSNDGVPDERHVPPQLVLLPLAPCVRAGYTKLHNTIYRAANACFYLASGL